LIWWRAIEILESLAPRVIDECHLKDTSKKITSMDSLPIELLQKIQSCDSDVQLYKVRRVVRSQRSVALGMLRKNPLFSNNLRSVRGSDASIAFAYSSGDLEHIISTIPLRKLNSTGKYRLRRLMLSGGFPYSTRMRFYKSLMFIKDLKHYSLLKE